MISTNHSRSRRTTSKRSKSNPKNRGQYKKYTKEADVFKAYSIHLKPIKKFSSNSISIIPRKNDKFLTSINSQKSDFLGAKSLRFSITRSEMKEKKRSVLSFNGEEKKVKNNFFLKVKKKRRKGKRKSGGSSKFSFTRSSFYNVTLNGEIGNLSPQY